MTPLRPLLSMAIALRLTPFDDFSMGIRVALGNILQRSGEEGCIVLRLAGSMAYHLRRSASAARSPSFATSLNAW